MLGEEPREELVRAINRAKNKQSINNDTAVILGWFKDYGEGLKELDETKEVVDYVYDENGLTVIYGDDSEQAVAQDGVYQLRTGGDEIEDEYVSPKEMVARTVTFMGNTINWNMPENNEEVLEVLNNLTVDSVVLDTFGIELDDCSSLRVQLAGGNVLYVDGWIIPEVKPILGKVLVAYFSGMTYDFVEEDLNKVADKAFS